MFNLVSNKDVASTVNEYTRRVHASSLKLAALTDDFTLPPEGLEHGEYREHIFATLLNLNSAIGTIKELGYDGVAAALRAILRPTFDYAHRALQFMNTPLDEELEAKMDVAQEKLDALYADFE